MAIIKKNALKNSSTLTGFSQGFAVTTADADQAMALDGITVATTGTYSVRFVNSTADVTVTLVSGLTYFYKLSRVNTTGSSTTAGIVGLVQ